MLRSIRVLAGLLALLLPLSAASILSGEKHEKLREAAELEKSGQLETAARLYQNLSNDSSLAFEALRGLGRVQYRMRQFDAAVSSFEQAAQLQPTDVETLRWLARSCLGSGDSQRVLNLLASAAVDKPEPWVYILRARAYDAQDKLSEATQELECVLALDPRYPQAHFALGFLAWSTRDAATAEKEFRQELARDPQHVRSLYYLAEVLEVTGKLQEAEKNIEQLARGSPDTYLTQFALGKLRERRRNLEQAAQHFRRAIRLEPHHHEPHYRLAVVLRRLGRAEEAKQELERSQELQKYSGPYAMAQGMGRMRPRLPDLDE